MAKQKGINKITGTLNGITYYEMNGEYYQRNQSSLTAKKVKTAPEFKNSRKASNFFGIASTWGKIIRRGINLTHPELVPTKLSSQFISAISKSIPAEIRKKPPAKFSVRNLNSNIIGFVSDPWNPPGKYLPHNIKVQLARNKKAWNLSLNPLFPEILDKFYKGADHFSLSIIMIPVPDSNTKPKVKSKKLTAPDDYPAPLVWHSLYFPKKTPVEELNLPGRITIPETASHQLKNTPYVCILAIQFFQKIGKTFAELNGGSCFVIHSIW